nr:MAG TPA: replisome organizer protein [Caudoviricetes sp.]
MRDSFVMYTANIDQILLLNMEQRGNLFTAIMLYAADKELPQMDGMTQMAFSFIKAQLDRDNQKYQKMIESRREAGKLGGRPKGSASFDKSSESKKANGFFEKQTEAKKHDNVNDNVNDKKNYCVRFEQMWQAYPRKKEKAAAYKAYKARLSDGFSEDELETAVKRYADDCKSMHTEERYIKHAATFFGPNTPFADYLKGDRNGPITGDGQQNTGGTQTYCDDYLEGVGEGFTGF